MAEQLRAADPQGNAVRLGVRAYEVYTGAAQQLERQRNWWPMHTMDDVRGWREEVMSEAIEAAEALGL